MGFFLPFNVAAGVGRIVFGPFSAWSSSPELVALILFLSLMLAWSRTWMSKLDYIDAKCSILGVAPYFLKFIITFI